MKIKDKPKAAKFIEKSLKENPMTWTDLVCAGIEFNQGVLRKTLKMLVELGRVKDDGKRFYR